MASEDSDRSGVDRRTLLRQLGAGSALAIGGLQRGAAASRQPEQRGGRPERPGNQPEGRPIPAGRYRPDTDHLPEVESAKVVVHEGGSVSKHLRVDGERLAERRQRESEEVDGPTVSTYSIGLELEAYDRERARALSEGRPDDAGLRAAVGRRDRPVRAGRPDVGARDESDPGANEPNGTGANASGPDGTGSNGPEPNGVGRGRGRGASSNDAAAASRSSATSASSVAASTQGRASAPRRTSTPGRASPAALLSHEDGIDGQPATGTRDYAAYGQTESQECGPLARTTVLSDAYTSSYGTWFYDATADRESVGGSACAGHRWNAKFEAFCTYLGFVPGYDCAIPSAFDTDWNVHSADRRGTRSGTVFTCGNFPAIPDTVVTAHDVTMTDGNGGVGVEFDSVVGVAPYNDFSDYDFDVNGISNLVVDGLSAVFPGLDSVYSYALATYLLDHHGAVVA